MASAVSTSPLLQLSISGATPETGKKPLPNDKKSKASDMKKDAPMTAGTVPSWKPPTHKERIQQAGEDGHVSSFRRWVSGEITTKQHKENIKRAKETMGYKD